MGLHLMRHNEQKDKTMLTLEKLRINLHQHTMQMRFHAAIRNKFVDKAADTFLRTYSILLDKIPVNRRLSISLQLKTSWPALLILPLQNFHSYFGPIFKNATTYTPKATFPES
ncbi:hypothetical protein NL676_033511 [Syzygium grande]|nr:hypothetical protein NL676_033511 [Syzygium grande]